jgi:hypothetical protein
MPWFLQLKEWLLVLQHDVAFHMSFTTCPIRLQWEKWLESHLSDLKNDYKNNYSWIWLVVKNMSWHYVGNKIFYY